jgi:transporter family protein
MDGTGWILYFQSIIAGPITIVGTLSAAYPALTTLFARIFLGEALTTAQYAGVFIVITSCALLSYSPTDPNDPTKSKKWIPMAVGALLIWGAGYTIMKHSYSLPGASEPAMSIYNSIGGMLTLGVYGFLYGRGGVHSPREWGRSFLPMAMMAGGDLGVIIASKTGPISIVTSLAGAYPAVTMAFAYFALKEHITKLQMACIAAILVGMFLCS